MPRSLPRSVWLSLSLALSLSACGSAPPPEAHAPEVERYRHILLPGADPNGLAWDADRRTLYVADDDRARVLVIVNGVVLGERPLPGAGTGGGGLAQLGDGSVACARFGTDGDGGVVRLLSDEAVRSVPSLDPERHRIGVASYGDLYVAWFAGTHDAWTGGVARVNVFSGGETDVLTGLGKAVGVAILGDVLVVSDQSHDSLIGCHLPDCADHALLATVPTPDLMASNDTEVFVSSQDGSVYAVTSEGTVRTAASELGGQPRGLAWDETTRHLFVAVHDPAEHPRHTIAIVDVPAPAAASVPEPEPD